MTSKDDLLDDPETPPAILLSDQPSETDEFESGGHERSARALAHSLTQLKDRNGAIGLEGKWGAGKSSVIRLAERALTETGRNIHHIFCFDLWAHQSDDFRRAFLEELIGWLDYDHLTTKQAEGFRDQIRDRTKTITYTVDRKYSWAGAIFILLAPLFPLVLAWLSPFAFAAMKPDVPGDLGYAMYLSAWKVMAFLYLVLFMRVGYLRCFAEEKIRKKDIPSALSSAIGVFKRDEETRTEEQNIREEDPTTLEFQKLFRDMLSTVQSDTKKIVLVFDNIDRLPPERVVDVWAEMRSVFTETDSSQDEARTAITVVVPYDLNLISEAFNYEYEAGFTENSPLEPDRPPRRSQAKDLIEKTFDVTIKVSPPLSLDWRKFLNSKIDEAFQHEVAEDTRWRLFRLFDLHCQQNGIYPTPRLIISYVNAIVTLWNQWGSEIPLESMGLYVLFRQEIESSPDMLKGSGPIHQRFVQVSQQTEWRRHLAAIHFNVSTEIAYQVLAGSDIGDALETENLERLDEIQILEFFEDVLVEVISDSASNWAREGGERFAMVIRALAHVDRKSEAFNHAWQLLIGVIVELPSIDVGEKNDSLPFATLLTHCDRSAAKNLGIRLLEKAEAGLSEESKRLVDDGKNWARFANAVLGELVKDDRRSVSRNNPLPGGVNFELGVAISSEAYEHIDFDNLWKRVTDDGLASAIIVLAAQNPGFVKSLATSNPKFFTIQTATSCVDAISAKLKQEDCKNELFDESINALLAVRLNSESQSHVQSSIKAMVADGTLAWYFDKIHLEEDGKLPGQTLFLISEVTEGGGAPDPVATHPVFGGLNSAYSTLDQMFALGGLNEEMASSVAQEVIRAELFGTWCEWAVGDEDNGFYQAVFKQMAAQPRYGPLILEDAVTSYLRIHEILGDRVAAHYLNLLQRFHSYMPDKFAGSKVLTVPLLFLEHVEAFNAPALRNLVTMLHDYFHGLTEPDWAELLKKNTEGLDHLAHLIENENYIPPAGEFRPALMSFFNDVIDSKVQATSYEMELDILAEGLAPATRTKFFGDFLRGLKERSVSKEGVNGLIQLFPKISRKLPFTKHSEISIDQVFIPLIWNGFDVGGQFFDDTSKQIGQCLKKAGDETQLRFIEAIEGLETSGEHEKVDWAMQLRESFGFPPKTVETDQEDQAPENSEGS